MAQFDSTTNFPVSAFFLIFVFAMVSDIWNPHFLVATGKVESKAGAEPANDAGIWGTSLKVDNTKEATVSLVHWT